MLLGVSQSTKKVEVTSLVKWSKSIQAITLEDERRTNKLLQEPNKQTSQDIRQQFYSLINMPLQSVCSVGKFFGGNWQTYCGAMDGHKYVCLDKLYADIQSGDCLIYSFGISDDWTFEEAMAQLGCTIRTFDPTIDGSKKPNSDQVNRILTKTKYLNMKF